MSWLILTEGVSITAGNELDQAIADFNTSISLDHNYSPAYLNRAISYYYQGDLDRAIADSNTAISLNPNFTAFLNRGAFLNKKGEYDKAILDELKAIELKPDDYSSYYNLACAYSCKNELEKSCEYLILAIQKGFCDWNDLDQDEKLSNLKKTHCFRNILKKN